MLLALPFVSLGVSLYQSSELGASPYDSLALTLDDRLPKIPYFWCRIAVDGTSTLLAFLLGGIVGWGTLACAFALGPSSTSLTNIFPSLSAKCRKMSRSPSKTRKKAEKTLDNRGKIRIIINDSLETYA